MGYNNAKIRDQFNIWADNVAPREAIEAKVVAGSVITFAHPITGGVPYVLLSDGGTVYFTLNGTNPALSDGIASASLGIPVPTGKEKWLMTDAAQGASYTLKCICSGSARSFVTLYKHSISASL